MKRSNYHCSTLILPFILSCFSLTPLWGDSVSLSDVMQEEALHKTEYDWKGPLFGWSKRQKEYLKRFDQIKKNKYLRDHCDHSELRRLFHIARELLIKEEYSFLDEMIDKLQQLIDEQRMSEKRFRKIYQKARLYDERKIRRKL